MRRRSRIEALTAAALASALVVGAAACGTSAESPVEAASPASAAPTTREDATTTSKPAPPTWPLTGAALADPAAAGHPAVVVKMDNSPDARPQSGLNQADVVYELLVEGITRYALVYHSEQADPVGPVRSGRSSDPPLLANLGAPLIVWSGGNPGVTAEITNAAGHGFLVDAGYNSFPGDYWREGSRKAPHNLYATTAALLEHAAPEGAAPPQPIFRFRPGAEPPTAGVEAAGLVIDFGLGVRAEYVWDAERQGWDRFQVDQRHSRENSATVDGDGVQVAPANVVVMMLEYTQSRADARSPMAVSEGEGEAYVLTGGKLVHGRWSRPNGLAPWELTDDNGNPILLSPGRTWVALPEVGSAVLPLDRATADMLLALRR